MNATAAHPLDVAVLIVGAGPTGLTRACGLMTVLPFLATMTCMKGAMARRTYLTRVC